MFTLKKTKGTYISPHTTVAEVDFEIAMLVPTSQTVNIQWDELENINLEEGDGVGTPLYFE